MAWSAVTGSASFGIRLPAFSWPGLGYADARRWLDYCRRVEEAGFTGIWAIDRPMSTPTGYRVASLDPLTLLSSAAAVTSTVQLGIAALVLPYRHPLLLAKELASLQFLSAGRLILGAAIGGDPTEFDAFQLGLSDRAPLTDECLALLRGLLTQDKVSFTGRWHSVRDVTIAPRPPSAIPVWVAGGTAARMPRPVLARLREADGWIAPSNGHAAADLAASIELVKDDRQRHGRSGGFAFASTLWVHIADMRSREAALAEQLSAYQRVFGPDVTENSARAVGLVGTIGEIQQQVAALGAAGLDHLILSPLTEDPGQLELLTRHLLDIGESPHTHRTRMQKGQDCGSA